MSHTNTALLLLVVSIPALRAQSKGTYPAPAKTPAAPFQYPQPGKPSAKSTVPPAEIHWCSGHCITLELDHGAPLDKPHYGSEAKGSMFVVEKWTREEVIMERNDYGAFPGKATLKGKLSPDGNSIVDGTITWTYHPRGGLGTGPFRAAWGPAIKTVPGDDRELAKETGADPDAPSGDAGSDADLQRAVFSVLKATVGASGILDDDDAGGGGIIAELRRLDIEHDHALSGCSVKGGTDAAGHCVTAERLEDQLSNLRDKLRDEAQSLKAQQQALAKTCNGGNKQACSKLSEVSRQLENDCNHVVCAFIK